MTTAFTNYAFTINNYTSTEWPAQVLDLCDYGIFGEEEGAEGTPHLQGFLHFKKRIAPKKVVKLNLWEEHGMSAHFTVCKGTFRQNVTYCSKDDLVHSFGDLPPDSELDAPVADWDVDYQALLDAPALTPELIRTFARTYKDRAGRALEGIKRLRTACRDPDPDLATWDNLWIHGLTGSGKTTRAKNLGPFERIWSTPAGHWFDPNFHYQRNLIIEDVTPGFCAESMKMYGDLVPFSANAKHLTFPGYRPSRTIVTSQYTIEAVFKQSTPEDRAAIKKRFVEVEHVKTF